ncbi:hypothetical protein [Stackebrandtia nassauensis]|uniref:Uncharacterized protein n=1 Tax=Stackebrandtia nassauensis (strain DSM 44728 / CIP 108903 / NRRL B-16338 / NBRC 102104 / LLR-40K-21) TaxID=446470 RepID=D3PUA5_STANL|nr:hypothetical protein [Stackebrandtia nassauensis]ADD41051.1 hypothetical protein Snas_1343 [Stackebrandtia nassauensis DSM 44728]
MDEYDDSLDDTSHDAELEDDSAAYSEDVSYDESSWGDEDEGSSFDPPETPPTRPSWVAASSDAHRCRGTTPVTV